jgi:hypothetical protein
MNQALREKNRENVKLWRDYIWLFVNALSELPPISVPTGHKNLSIGMHGKCFASA